jgi:hypothetical protein
VSAGLAEPHVDELEEGARRQLLRVIPRRQPDDGPAGDGLAAGEHDDLGTYEYLSAARGPDSRDAFAGMKGELIVR